MFIVTGGRGFIGRHIVEAVNRKDTIIFERGDDIETILSLNPKSINGIYHQGACADTTMTDWRVLIKDNLQLSCRLINFAVNNRIPIVYASSAAVYGRSTSFAEISNNEHPINDYAQSKLIVDSYARYRMGSAKSALVGLRYFNVYGHDEASKGHMASMPYQLKRQSKETGKMRIFADGSQRRDFICVDDVVKINMFFMKSDYRGVVNAGTGKSTSFNELTAIFPGSVEHIPFPASLAGKYQDFTEADLTNLRKAGYQNNFVTLKEYFKNFS